MHNSIVVAKISKNQQKAQEMQNPEGKQLRFRILPTPPILPAPCLVFYANYSKKLLIFLQGFPFTKYSFNLSSFLKTSKTSLGLLYFFRISLLLSVFREFSLFSPPAQLSCFSPIPFNSYFFLSCLYLPLGANILNGILFSAFFYDFMLLLSFYIFSLISKISVLLQHFIASFLKGDTFLMYFRNSIEYHKTSGFLLDF